MIFLTYNDSYSGIYQSQVIDVCDFMEKELYISCHLLALVSLRNYKQQRNAIKTKYPNAIVLPMFPKNSLWRFNAPLLFIICLLLRQKKIWARGAFSTDIALLAKKSGIIKHVIFDARAAYWAELNEYNVNNNPRLNSKIGNIENNALTQSQAQLAVSSELQKWWKEKYGFIPVNSHVIPCTLSHYFLPPFIETEINASRAKLNYNPQDIIIAYSGSSAAWQSFSQTDDILYRLLEENKNTKLLFLTDKPPLQSKTFTAFQNRITTLWVKISEVRPLLMAADYGFLVREQSVTNRVASPVKFAEYLACGLQVIISEQIGDFSALVENEKCGFIYKENIQLTKPAYAQKLANYSLAMQNFCKNNPQIKAAYMALINP